MAKAAHGGTYRLLVPFFGGPDDRLALEFAVQLCANPKICATVVRVRKAEVASELVQGKSFGDKDKPPPPAYNASEGVDTHQNTATIASVSIPLSFFSFSILCSLSAYVITPPSIAPRRSARGSREPRRNQILTYAECDRRSSRTRYTATRRRRHASSLRRQTTSSGRATPTPRTPRSPPRSRAWSS